MESQGRYDFAIVGEGIAAWVAALLLARQGDRVLVVPQGPPKREFTGRILFGLETNGILLRMLERWGLPRSVLEGKRRARMECLTPETSLWVQGSLKDRALGAPAFELQGKAYEQVLSVVDQMEDHPEWKTRFEQEFIRGVRQSTQPKWNRVPFMPNTSRQWKRMIRKVVAPQAKGVVLPREKSATGEGAGRLLRGLGHFLSREESWIKNAPHPVQIASDLFALRNAYFSDEILDSLKGEFHKLLRATGVEFLSEQVHPHFKRDSSGLWEAFYEAGKGMKVVQFDQMILTSALEEEWLNRFEEKARKRVEADLDPRKLDRYELEVRFQVNPFPFQEPAELVSRSPSGGWLRLSVYPEPRPCVRVGAWVPLDQNSNDAHQKIVTERRLLRELKESLPGLEADLVQSEVTTEIHREHRFKYGIGVRGKTPGLWHAHLQSFPKMGEYGPVLAAIEIARQRARKKKRELVL